jgi:phosphoglycolate phosphatase-like HAD superfamily hydrolase
MIKFMVKPNESNMKLLFIFFFAFVVLSIQSCKESQPPDHQVAEHTTTQADPLPSWNEGASKKSIIDFVTKTTTECNPDFVPVRDRIACFDNDGTLWSEQPMYFQLAFAIDEIKRMAPQHPEWKTKQPLKALLEGDIHAVLVGGEPALMEIMKVTHSGMTTEAFEKSVKDWIRTARHPKTGTEYTSMVYQPMLELLDYLRGSGFKTFIVSGGGVDFMRPWMEQVYGIPPDQIVGSSGKVKYEVMDGKPTLTKMPEVNFIDDKEGKPIGIHQYIGKRPVFTAGNSDGDYAMLQWTTSSPGPRFGMIVHHTDSIREVAYDRGSHIGKLEKGLDDAMKNNWVLVSMKDDWKIVFPSQ